MPYLENWPIQKITPQDKDYPQQLKKIQKPAMALYYRGDLPNSQQCFAIVGTRKASDYGKEIAFSFAWQMAKQGLIIVSGMALGIDSFAHKGALQVAETRPPQELTGVCPLPTIAILGTGLDEQIIYPHQNLKLAKQILEKNGCLISEYPPEYPGAKFTFLERNRIIAGMSLGVLIVEAKIKSGALNTADWAKKQGKKVFAAPGSVFSQNSKGCHLLIKQGAILTENVNDILKELNLAQAEKISYNPQNIQEKMIMDVLKQGALNVDKIIEKTNLPAQLVSSTICLMEIDGKIKNLGGNVYALSG